MQIELEVAVGDVIRIGDHTLLILETQGQEVTFKVCSNDELEDSGPLRPLLQPR